MFSRRELKPWGEKKTEQTWGFWPQVKWKWGSLTDTQRGQGIPRGNMKGMEA